MSVYIDRKYLLIVSSRLQRFAQKKEDLFNFRCPYCGDSKKNKIKARGYIFRKNNDYFYTCHNCQASTTFSKFLKHIDADTHSQYVLERYTAGENGNSNYEKPKFNNKADSSLFDKFSDKLNIKNIKLKSIAELPEDHYASTYIIDRGIPKEYWNEIFYHNSFKEFMDSSFPNHGKEDIPNDSRIILFYTNEKGEITNVAGRALGKSPIRYCTIKVTDDKKLFGMHRVRKSERIYVVEGQFDSLFISNCIASGDSNLCSVAEHLSDCEVVLIFDKEPRNKEIVKQIEKAIDKGYNVCLLPDELPGKDINEMVLSGITNIVDIINDNTFSGLTAKLKFVEWKKC